MNKTRRWHIDYLLALGEIKDIFALKTEEQLECSLAQELAKHFMPAVRGFGSGDCRCETHLFRASGLWELLVSEAMSGLTAGRANDRASA